MYKITAKDKEIATAETLREARRIQREYCVAYGGVVVIRPDVSIRGPDGMVGRVCSKKG